MQQEDIKTTEAYFRSLNEMLRTEGWKNFLIEVQATATQANQVEFTKDANDLYYRKGQLAVLTNILNFETQVTNAQDEFEASQNASFE